MIGSRAIAWLCCALFVLACGDDAPSDSADASHAPDAHFSQDASSLPAQPEFHDASQAVPDRFVPPDGPAPILAHGDAAPQPDAAPNGEAPMQGCLTVEPGETLTFEDRGSRVSTCGSASTPKRAAR